MPYKKRYRRKRAVRKRRPMVRVPPRNIMINKYRNCFPPTFYTSDVYTARFDFNTAPYQEQLFRVNSLYDPDFTGVGGSTLYYDKLTTIYSKFCITKCAVYVRWWQASATFANQFATIGMYVNNNVSTETNTDDAIANRGCMWKILNTYSGAPNTAYMKLKLTPAVLFGVSKRVYSSEDTFSHEVSSNPTRQQILHLFAGSQDGINNVYLKFQIKIVYRVKCMELQDEDY